jgi:hypothetical protein
MREEGEMSNRKGMVYYTDGVLYRGEKRKGIVWGNRELFERKR